MQHIRQHQGVKTGPDGPALRGSTGDTKCWPEQKKQMVPVPCGKHTRNDGKPPFRMGRSTISMAIVTSYVSLEGNPVMLSLFSRLTRWTWL